MGVSSALGISIFEMGAGQQFERHVHDYHQLAWASSGTLMVDVDDHYWVIPTALALWIPAGTWHVSKALKDSVMHGIYLHPSTCETDWRTPTAVAVTPLARQLIEYLRGDLAESARLHAQTVLLEVLGSVDKTAIEVPMPTDTRAREVAEILLADPSDQRSLKELGRSVGASPRTLLRLFAAETGLTFNAWRTHARLQCALPYLAEGESVATVADQVGYTASAFVAAFRRVTGHTPAGYFSTDNRPAHARNPSISQGN